MGGKHGVGWILACACTGIDRRCLNFFDGVYGDDAIGDDLRLSCTVLACKLFRAATEA